MADTADTRTSTAGLGGVLGTAQSTKSGSTCTVSIGGTTTIVEVARDLTVAIGDVLILMRIGAAWWAVARAYAAAPVAPPNDPAPPPQPASTSGRLVVTPVETASWRTSYGWRTDNDDVYQGQYGGYGLHRGCAFYGTKPRSLAGATVTAASVRVRRESGGSFASVSGTLVKITEATRPGGAPTVTGGQAVTLPAVGSSSTLTVPAAYAQALVDGTVGGLGLYVAGGTPYARTSGRGGWGLAWTLSIDWTR